MTEETVQEYMKRRQQEALEERLRRKYRTVENSAEANELQLKSVRRWNKGAKRWREGCGLDD